MYHFRWKSNPLPADVRQSHATDLLWILALSAVVDHFVLQNWLRGVDPVKSYFSGAQVRKVEVSRTGVQKSCVSPGSSLYQRHSNNESMEYL